MAFTVEAIYENGVLKPAEPLPLKEHEKVSVTVGAGLSLPIWERIAARAAETPREEVYQIAARRCRADRPLSVWPSQGDRNKSRCRRGCSSPTPSTG